MTTFLKSNNLLKFNPDTLEKVRKEYDLDQLKMTQAVDILEEWIKKQEHFVKKDFNREYLERVIISTKGSVERAKIRVDKLCTMRTLVPELFEKCDVKNDLPNVADSYINIVLPKITEDNYRIFIVQVKGNITSSVLMEAYQYSVTFCEYLKLNDYCHGATVVIDVRHINIMEFLKNVNLTNFRNILTLYTEGFGFKIKNFLILSDSKMVDALVSLLRQVLSAKLGKRIQVIRDMESLYEKCPRHMLPKDLGGEEKSLMEIYDEWTEELASDEHVKYVKEMREACTNEAYRRSDKFTEEYLGMPGSFKTLTVD